MFATNVGTLTEDVARVRRGELASALRHDLTSYNGPSIVYGIVMACATYPLSIAAVILVWLVARFVLNSGQIPRGMDLIDLVAIPFFIMGYAAGAAVISLAWTTLISMITLPVVYWVVRSLRLHGNLVWLGAFSGGLVGFIAILPFTLSLPRIMSPIDIWIVLVALPLGPGLATVLGQIGGAWGGWRASLHLANYYGIVATSNSSAAGEVALELLADATETANLSQERRWQFGLRHMMWLIVWLSLLLSVIRLSGIAFEYAVPLLAGWSMFQWLTLRIGRWIIQRFGPRWTTWCAGRST